MKLSFVNRTSVRRWRTEVLSYLSLTLCLSLHAFSQSTASQPPLSGYSDLDAQKEIQWEKKFQAIPSADRLRDNMQRLAARPHHVGSPYDKDNAE